MVRLRELWAFLCVCLILALVSTPGSARAQGSRAYPINVLAIDSDDAEDQADALTTALRSRVRATPSYALAESTASLGTLTAALKCPKIPDASCLQRISEQLKTDRFIWGVMAKAPGNQVTVDLHLFAKGKPDIAAKETYSDNLKDQNDEILRHLAQRLFERLSGINSTGTFTFHAGDSGGTVTVDGQTRALEKGEATLELPPGVHTYEVVVAGFRTVKEIAVIVSGKDTRVNVPLQADAAPTEAASKPPAVRKIIGYGAIGTGVVFLVVSGVEALDYLNLHSQQTTAIQNQIPNGIDACSITSGPHVAAANDACDRYHSGIRVSTAGWIFGGIGVAAIGTGIVLLATDTSSDAAPDADRPRARVRLVPELGPSVAGLRVLGSF